MAIRALVIAIEDYSIGKGLPDLKGVNRDAVKFIKWLIEKKGIKGDSILCCAGAEFVADKDGEDYQKTIAELAKSPVNFKGRTAGTTKNEIINEIARLVNWRDRTEELYIFFSGHGYSYKDEKLEKKKDVLVAADFPNEMVGGNYCVDVSEIKYKLGAALGSNCHYYFVDICRTEAPQGSLDVAGTGLALGRSALGDPNLYSLFSTAQGAVAKTTSEFTPNLVDGLSGAGRAKYWDGTRLRVDFNRLCKYVRYKLTPVDQFVQCNKDDLRDVEDIIFELPPEDPKYKTTCQIIIDDADENDEFTVRVINIKDVPEVSENFTGPQHKLSLKPDDYFIEVTQPNATLVRYDPPVANPDLLDCFNSTVTLRFRKQPTQANEVTTRRGRAGGLRTGRTASLTLIGAEHTKILLKNLQNNAIEMINPGQRTSIRQIKSGKVKPQERVRLNRVELIKEPPGVISKPSGPIAVFEASRVVPGKYEVESREAGAVVFKQSVEIKPGAKERVDMLGRSSSAAHRSIIKAVGGRATARLPELSSKLAPMANWDLGLWLSLLGAAHIAGAPNQYQRLRKVPLTSFDDVQGDEAIVYVLAGFETLTGPFRFAVSDDHKVDWQAPRRVEKLENVYEFRAKTKPGSHILSLKIAGQRPYSYAIHCLPNRATFITFSEDSRGIKLHQFILYIHKLKMFLDPEVRRRLNRDPFMRHRMENNPLDWVRAMFLIQSHFALRQNIEKVDDSDIRRDWEKLLYMKWFDPIMSVIAAYEIIRRGRAKEVGLDEMVENLRRYFPGLPDTEAIARSLKLPGKIPQAAPLLLESVMAFTKLEETRIFQLNPRLLDFDGIWTTWRGAVNDIELTKSVQGTSKEDIENPKKFRAAGVGQAKKAAKQSVAKKASKKQPAKKSQRASVKKAGAKKK